MSTSHMAKTILTVSSVGS